MDFARDLVDPDKLQTLKCSRCDAWLVLSEASFERVVDGIEVQVEDLPVLYCADCDLIHLPGRSKGAIWFHVHEAKRHEKPRVVVSRRPEAKQRRFDFCSRADFLYDATDHDYLPGVQGRDGFLTPLFFNKSALIKYMNHPSYALELGSDSYGSVYKNGEHLFPFGINRSGKVIAWLGDIDRIDLDEQYYLRSENVPSDHDIGSDFYLGQIEAVFTDDSRERRVFRLRAEVGKKFLHEYGLRLNVYDLEVLSHMAEVVRPVTWGEKEVRGVIEALNKVLIESLNTAGLRTGIQVFNAHEDLKNLAGLKLMQKWLGLAYPTLDARTIMRPFFVLYDFRIVAAHLIGRESAEEKLRSCYERMHLAEGSYETLFDALIAELVRSYEQMLAAATPARPVPLPADAPQKTP